MRQTPKRGLPFAVAAAVACFFLPAWALDPIQQDGGPQNLVSVEAEHYDAVVAQGGHDWLPASNTGSSGTGALVPLPEDTITFKTDYATGSPRLDFLVNFVTTGTHYVWVRALAPSTSSDSLHAGLDGAEIPSATAIAGLSPTNSWVWSRTTQTGSTATLPVSTPGPHIINVYMRESGTVFDKLVLTTDPAYIPAGTGPAESPRSATDANLPPTLAPIGNRSVVEDQLIRFTVTATDPEGAIAALGATGVPPGASFSDNLDGTAEFSWTPSIGAAGTYSITFTATDAAEPPLSDGETIALMVTSIGSTAPFQQDGGSQKLVSVEAENHHGSVAQGGHAWLSAPNTGASGSGAFVPLPEDTITFKTGYATGSPRLDIQVNFVATGTHYIWVRALAPSTSSDSLHVGLDGAEIPSAADIAGLSPTNNWVWSRTTQTGTTATLPVSTPGLHTVNVYMRESGTVVDKLVLTTDPTYTPTGTGPPESPRSAPGGNLPPTLAPIGNRAVVEDQLLSFTVMATDSSGGNPALSATGVPTGASFTDNLDGTGAFGWTPLIGAAGTYSITFTATDSAEPPLSASETVTIAVAAINATAAFRQDGGPQKLVSVEAENYHDSVAQGGHGWLPASNPGYSGAGAFAPLPEDSLLVTSGYASNSPRLDYQIDFVTNGTHYVWIRALGPSDSSDSLHVGLDGAEIPSAAAIAQIYPTGNWVWSKRRQSGAIASISVATPGVHTLNVWMRESGTVFDKLVLTTDPSYTPVGMGPAESPRDSLQAVQTPVITPNSGSFSDSVTVTLATGTPGAAIRYTLDGIEPMPASTLYDGPFVLTQSATVKATAYLDGYADSGVASTHFSVGYPTYGWPTATPADMQMDASKLDEARDFALTGGGSGFITRGGRLVMSWGNPSQIYDVKSTTKSIGVTALGLALIDGRLSLNDPAQTHLPSIGVPPDANANTGWLDEISVLGLAAHSAGFDRAGSYVDLIFRPNTTWAYSVAGANWLADMLTVVYGEDLESLMFQRVFSPLGIESADLTWRDNNYRDDTINGVKSREFGAGISANVDAMARIGYLYLRGGVWDGIRILPEAFVNQATRPLPQILNLPVGDEGSTPAASHHYGLLWWNNADGALPGVPADTFWSWGLDDSLIVVIPSLDIVVSRAGSGWQPGWTSDYSVLAPFLLPITESVSPVPINLPPVLGSIGSRSVAAGSTLHFTARTADYTPALMQATGLPAGATFVDHGDGTATFHWLPPLGLAGAFPVSFTAIDATDPLLTAAEAITITVIPPPSVRPFIQDGGPDGLVSMEAENFDLRVAQGGYEWLAASNTGYSGTGARVPLPEDRLNISVDYASLSPRLDYQVYFVTAGTYQIWARALGPATHSDSLHVGLDGQEVPSAANIAEFLPTGSWVWSKRTTSGTTATLSVPTPGVHTVNVWMRESGVVFDKLVLTANSAYTPTGLGPAESPRTELPVVQTPLISPNGGTFLDSITVTLATATSNANIRYTLDGSEPTLSSTTYSGPLVLTSWTTVKAKGFADGHIDSALASATFASLTGSPDMIHYWQLNEPGGAVFEDFVGENPATCVNCPTSVSGVVGAALQFDGVEDELEVASNGTFDWDSSSRFTVEFWIHTPACAGQQAVIGRRDPLTPMRWWAGCEGGRAAFHLVDSLGAGSSQPLIGSRNIADGQWHQIVAIRDSIAGQNRLYVDAILDGSVPIVYSGGFEAAFEPLTIGSLDDAGQNYHFAGTVDEIALHDRVLSGSVISRHRADGTIGLKRGYWGCSSPVLIMPVGDSITRRVGYRPPLYSSLTEAGYYIDFVGGGQDTCSSTSPCAYDPDHEGHSGYTAPQVAAEMDSWLGANPPEVMLLHIGTNEDPESPYPDPQPVRDILDVTDGFDPAITVVLARIINQATYEPLITAFNSQVASMAEARIAGGDKILLVNHESALVYPDDMLDLKHPNDNGYEKMAEVWFNGLQGILPACFAVPPRIISDAQTAASIGIPYQYTVRATGHPLPGFGLVTAPAGMSIHPDTGQIDWTPAAAGSFSVVVEANNPSGTSTQIFTITVP